MNRSVVLQVTLDVDQFSRLQRIATARELEVHEAFKEAVALWIDVHAHEVFGGDKRDTLPPESERRSAK